MQWGNARREEQSKWLEEQLQCVPCSRETERSRGVPADKNIVGSWKTGFNVFLVPGRPIVARECPPTITEPAVGKVQKRNFPRSPKE